MADNKNTEDEPSIEEILSSIRDIISEDDESESDAEAEAHIDDDSQALVEKVFMQDETADDDTSPADTKPVEPEEDDVLELTDIAEDEEDSQEQGMEQNSGDDPLAGIDLGHSEGDDLEINDGLDDILDGEAIEKQNDNVDEDVSVVAAEPEIKEDIMNHVDVDDNAEDALVDKIAESATVGAMAKLAENIAVSRTKEGVTLEDIVKQSLRPMLKDWLDENLPTLIERLVSQELERLANKAAGK